MSGARELAASARTGNGREVGVNLTAANFSGIGGGPPSTDDVTLGFKTRCSGYHGAAGILRSPCRSRP